MTGSNTCRRYEPKGIVSVRPRRDGKWEVVNTTHEENHRWKREWNAWMEAEGNDLARLHPDWWPKQ